MKPGARFLTFVFLGVLLFASVADASKATKSESHDLSDTIILDARPKNQIVANFNQSGASEIQASVLQVSDGMKQKKLPSESPKLTAKDQEFRDLMAAWEAANLSEDFSEEDCKRAGVEGCESSYQERSTRTNSQTGQRVFVS